MSRTVADKDAAALHEADSVPALAEASFRVIGRAVEHELLFLALRPIEFELPSISSVPAYQWACDKYIEGGHKYDVWLRRSPIHPGVSTVRHGDYTSQAELHETPFYQDIMSRVNCEYGASLVAWRENAWLATLTVFRNAAQGEFSDEDMAFLNDWQLPFSCAVRRVATANESRLGPHSLEAFIWGLPTAAVVLDWDLNVLHRNAAAEEMAWLWRMGHKAAAVKRSRTFQIPGDIRAAIEEIKPEVSELKGNRPGSPRMVSIKTVHHGKMPELSARISFLPAKALTVTKGTFLINLERNERVLSRRTLYDRLCQLTKREREVVRLAASGKSAPEIGGMLGTAPITVRLQLRSAYQKLGIKTRYELITAFADVSGEHGNLAVAVNN